MANGNPFLPTKLWKIKLSGFDKKEKDVNQVLATIIGYKKGQDEIFEIPISVPEWMLVDEKKFCDDGRPNYKDEIKNEILDEEMKELGGERASSIYPDDITRGNIFESSKVSTHFKPNLKIDVDVSSKEVKESDSP